MLLCKSSTLSAWPGEELSPWLVTTALTTMHTGKRFLLADTGVALKKN